VPESRGHVKRRMPHLEIRMLLLIHKVVEAIGWICEP
jgi:hypothetical protein